MNVLRDAMSVDWMDPCGVYFGTTGGQVYASANGGDSWSSIAEHLPSVLSVEVQDGATLGSLLDALEDRYPMLRGMVRDHVTLKRRPMVRFFVCGEDLSFEPADTPLPEAVVEGREPFIIVGAIAGG